VSDPLFELLKTGTVGVILAAGVVALWRALEAKNKEQREDRQKLDKEISDELKTQTAMLKRIAEKLIKIDNRTFEAEGKGKTRSKTLTPFWPDDGPPDDKEK
jgi:Tfp pilus assembly protein PilN